jgi:hypothetical protein
MICRVCQQDKEPSKFYTINKKQPSRCGACQLKSEKRRMSNLKKFGITPKDYQELLEKQQHKCAICRAPHLETPIRKWARARLAVDHDHHHGHVRGLLCHKCNMLLGYAHDDTTILTKAISYLEETKAA